MVFEHYEKLLMTGFSGWRPKITRNGLIIRPLFGVSLLAWSVCEDLPRPGFWEGHHGGVEADVIDDAVEFWR